MTRARPSYTPTPRILDKFQTSVRLGHTESWFNKNRAQLEAQGFPKYDGFLGGWDADAIEYWLDRRSGLAEDATDHGLESRLEAMG